MEHCFNQFWAKLDVIKNSKCPRMIFGLISLVLIIVACGGLILTSPTKTLPKVESAIQQLEVTIERKPPVPRSEENHQRFYFVWGNNITKNNIAVNSTKHNQVLGDNNVTTVIESTHHNHRPTSEILRANKVTTVLNSTNHRPRSISEILRGNKNVASENNAAISTNHNYRYWYASEIFRDNNVTRDINATNSTNPNHTSEIFQSKNVTRDLDVADSTNPNHTSEILRDNDVAIDSNAAISTNHNYRYWYESEIFRGNNITREKAANSTNPNHTSHEGVYSLIKTQVIYFFSFPLRMDWPVTGTTNRPANTTKRIPRFLSRIRKRNVSNLVDEVKKENIVKDDKLTNYLLKIFVWFLILAVLGGAIAVIGFLCRLNYLELKSKKTRFKAAISKFRSKHAHATDKMPLFKER